MTTRPKSYTIKHILLYKLGTYSISNLVKKSLITKNNYERHSWMCHLSCPKIGRPILISDTVFNIKSDEKKIPLSFLKIFYQSKIIWTGQMAQVSV